MKAEFENELKVIILEMTIRSRLLEVGLYGHVAREKPYVNKVNRRKHLEYPKTHREKPFDFWNKVLWSDDGKFNRVSDG